MPFVYREVKGLGYYEVSAWGGASGVFTTRLGGESRAPYESLNLSSSSGDDPKAVEANRGRLCGALGIDPRAMRSVRQVHGSEVYVLSDPAAGMPKTGYDAIVTDVPGVAVSVLTADCVPVLMYDPLKRAVAAVHAGWAGTVRGIAGRVVRAMSQAYGSDPDDIRVAIGPSIGPCCYEVDEKVVSPLRENMPNGGGLIFPSRPGHWQLDLWEANTRLILSAGIRKSNIHVMGVCTSCNTDKFFSHRKSGGTTGRMMALVRLTG